MLVADVLVDRVLKLDLHDSVTLQNCIDVEHLDVRWLVGLAVHKEVIDVLHLIGLLDIFRVDTLGLVRFQLVEQLELTDSFRILYVSQFRRMSYDELINDVKQLFYCGALLVALLRADRKQALNQRMPRFILPIKIFSMFLVDDTFPDVVFNDIEIQFRVLAAKRIPLCHYEIKAAAKCPNVSRLGEGLRIIQQLRRRHVKMSSKFGVAN